LHPDFLLLLQNKLYLSILKKITMKKISAFAFLIIAFMAVSLAN